MEPFWSSAFEISPQPLARKTPEGSMWPTTWWPLMYSKASWRSGQRMRTVRSAMGAGFFFTATRFTDSGIRRLMASVMGCSASTSPMSRRRCFSLHGPMRGPQTAMV